jgi:acetyl esterase/lipase
MNKRQTIIFLALAALGGCSSMAGQVPTISTQTAPARGDLVSIVPLEVREQAQLQAMASEFPGGITVSEGVSLFRITYRTTYKDSLVIASGLVGVPSNGSDTKGVVMYLHGTTNTRTLSPSQPDRADGNSDTAIFGGNGYVVALPDYIGLGESNQPQAFVVTKPQVDASVDMLRALRTFTQQQGISWNSNLFLMGFSQGGQSAAGLHRALEQQPLPEYRLRGTVAVAGPHDLRGLSSSKSGDYGGRHPLNIGYLAFTATAYASYYDKPLGELLQEPYSQTMPGLFDGSKTIYQIGAGLPGTTSELLVPDAYRAITTNADHWLTRKLDENETYAWVPVAPVRIFVGEADTNVAPSMSRALYDYAAPRGGAVSVHSFGDVDHMGTISLSYAPTLAWFNALASQE